MDTFEVLVIGGGPGGYLCAERAAQGGFSVLLIEKNKMGGTCLNEGCVPTKALLNCAKMYRHATESAAFGVKAENVTFDHKKALAHKKSVVRRLVGGVEAAMKANKVTVVKAEAKITGRTADGFTVEAGGTTYVGRRLVIASGSETTKPPIPGLKEGLASGFVVTNTEVLDMEDLPKTMVLMGGGIIGLEMGLYFASAGVKVTVVEMLDKVAGPTEKEASEMILKSCQAKGMEVFLSSKVSAVKEGAVVAEKDGKTFEVPCDKVLLALGRAPYTAGLGLENINVEMDRRAIKVDDKCRTSVAGVYAIGDCNGKLMLAHTAYREAEVAVNDMLGKKDSVNYGSISSVIYTDPECASVGETLDSAKAKGINAKEVRLPLQYSGRYMAENPTGTGFLKLVADADSNTLIGAQMVGGYASETIVSLAMMVDSRMPIERLKKFVFPHPTVGEVAHDALYSL